MEIPELTLFIMNIAAYLDRIKYSGKKEPTFEVLHALQKAHLFHIPFENLDIHFNRPIILNTEKIFEKIIINQRGGFCYELNGLFYELLQSLGFSVTRISARVYNSEKGYGQEFDHFALLVNVEGQKYLCDVGFGEFAFSPLKFELNMKQKDARGIFLIDKFDDNYFRVNKLNAGKLIPEYIFKTIPRKLKDYQQMCFYHQKNPNSHFTKKKLISRPTENGRITLTDNMLKITDKENIQEIKINNDEAFHAALWNYFNIKI